MPLTLIALATAVLAALLVVLPSPIGMPVAWQPPPLPAAEGPLTPNTVLQGAARLGDESLEYPEDLIFDADGRLYTGTADGFVWRLDLDANGDVASQERFADIGEGVLGLQFDAGGNLIAAVPGRGLVSIGPDGGVTVLADEAGGTPITYANELAIGDDGTIYFSDSSSAYDAGWPYDFLEGRPHGRLLSYDPATGDTTVLGEDLYFPNGVVLSPDEDFLVFAETFRYRLSRLWLAGPRAGEIELFADNLPVAPDNITLDGEDSYWIGGGGGPRSAAQDLLQSNAWLKEAVAKLVPYDTLRGVPAAQRYGYVLRLAADGSILASYHDPTGGVHTVSSAVLHGDHVYLGTLYGRSIARVPLAEFADDAEALLIRSSAWCDVQAGC